MHTTTAAQRVRAQFATVSAADYNVMVAGFRALTEENARVHARLDASRKACAQHERTIDALAGRLSYLANERERKARFASACLALGSLACLVAISVYVYLLA